MTRLGGLVKVTVAGIVLGAAGVGASPPSLQELAQTAQANDYGQVYFIPEMMLQARAFSELGLNKVERIRIEEHLHPRNRDLAPGGPHPEAGVVYQDPNCLAARKVRRSLLGDTLPGAIGRAAGGVVGTVEGAPLYGYSPFESAAGRLLEIRVEEVVGSPGVELTPGDVIYAFEVGAEVETKDGTVCDQPRIGDFQPQAGDRVLVGGGFEVKGSRIFGVYMLLQVVGDEVEIPTELGFDDGRSFALDTVLDWIVKRAGR